MSVQDSLGGRGNAAPALARPGAGTPEAEPQPSQAVPLQLPERPELAPGVSLAGQMRDSGYADPPWLLERVGSGYVQVTELLYRVAEQLDGQKDHEEIAQAVSDATDRAVSADNVRQLLATQFLAKGLIPSADGRVVHVPAGRSLLAIRMKTRAVPPAAVNRAAAGLKFLFLPPVMVLVLAACAALQVWIFAYHGVAPAVHQAFYTSGLALAVLVLVVLAAGVHEFGHAAALKYGGGKPGPMGVGMYLVYPAFYTDVTDNYRLSRWSRLRTDLGGFYFNILFVLGLAGLYFATGWEFLLLVIVIIDFQILHQLLPFVRLDGYWTLVDLTGLPDFFQQIPAFFKSLVPRWFPGQAERPASPLKWWARVVLGVYILVTVPLLALLLMMMAVSLPRVLATAVDAAGKQATGFVAALGSGDIPGAVLHPLQLVLVLLPVAGAALILSGIVRRTATRLLRWSDGSPTRRVLAGAGATAAAGLLLFAWVPGLGLPGSGGDDGFVARSSWKPIEPHERGTLSDSGVVLVREVGPHDGGAAGAAEARETPSPTAAASATREPFTTATPGTPTATRPASGSPTATAQASAPSTPTPVPAQPSPTSAPDVASVTPQPSPTGVTQ